MLIDVSVDWTQSFQIPRLCLSVQKNRADQKVISEKILSHKIYATYRYFSVFEMESYIEFISKIAFDSSFFLIVLVISMNFANSFLAFYV